MMLISFFFSSIHLLSVLISSLSALHPSSDRYVQQTEPDPLHISSKLSSSRTLSAFFSLSGCPSGPWTHFVMLLICPLQTVSVCTFSSLPLSPSHHPTEVISVTGANTAWSLRSLKTLIILYTPGAYCIYKNTLLSILT